MDKKIKAIRRLEEIEDELARVDGMQGFRERLTSIRSDIVGAEMDDIFIQVRSEPQHQPVTECVECGEPIDGDTMVPRGEGPMDIDCWLEWTKR